MRVLIAEDDQLIRQGLMDLLEVEGYDCLEAEDGEQAFNVYAEQSPDLVLLDIMMPKKDGYQVCREIRKQDENVPVIFITAKSEEIDQVLGLELGADDYIKKPFGTREVVARIRAVTRRLMKNRDSRIGESGGTTFQMIDVTIYPEELRACRGNVVMELSLRDVKVLSLLAQNPGKVITRNAMFNDCWGRDYFANSRTLDQHISKLRKLIELDPKQPQIIQTVHGVGYRFDSNR